MGNDDLIVLEDEQGRTKTFKRSELQKSRPDLLKSLDTPTSVESAPKKHELRQDRTAIAGPFGAPISIGLPMNAAADAMGMGNILDFIYGDKSKGGEAAVDIGQMAGGLAANFLPGGVVAKNLVYDPILSYFTGEAAGRGAEAMGAEGVPDSDSQLLQSIIGSLIGAGVKGGTAVGQDVGAFRRGIKTGDFENNPSVIGRWLSNRYLPKDPAGKPYYQKHEPILSEYTDEQGNVIGETPNISEREALELLRSKNYHITTGQATGSEIAHRQAAGAYNLPDILLDQNKTIREMAGDISKTGVSQTPQTRGARWENLTAGNVDKQIGLLSKEQQDIIRSSSRDHKPLEFTKPETGEDGKTVLKTVRIQSPIYIEQSQAYARSVSKEVGRLDESTISGPLLKKFKSDWKNVRTFLSSDIYKATDIAVGKEVPVTEIGDLLKVRESIRRISGLDRKLTPMLEGLQRSIDKDLANHFDSTSYGLGRKFVRLQNELDDLSDFKATKLGTTLGSRTGEGGFKQRIKSTEEGLEAALLSNNSADFDRLIKINGKKQTGEMLKEAFISEMFKDGEASTAGAESFLRTHASKFSKTLDSEERHAINRFVAALKIHDRRINTVRYEPAFSRGEESSMKMAFGTMTPQVFSGRATQLSGVGGRVYANLAYLKLDKGALSKIVTNPQFSYAAAKLMELPSGSPATKGPLKTILGLAAKAGVTFTMDIGGQEVSVTPTTNSQFLIPEGGSPIKVDAAYMQQ